MTNFVWLGDRYLNADHVVMVRECKSSFEYGSDVYIDVLNPNGNLMIIRAEEKPEELIEKICGSEVLR